MKLSTFLRSASVVLAAAVLGGCASIISGSTQEVTFNSTPDGATVTVAGRVIGKTPITTSLKKKSGQALVFSKDGYKPVSMQLETRMNGWFWGNIVFGGLFGSTTDSASGAVNEYSPSQYLVSLQPEGTSSVESKTSLNAEQKAREYAIIAYQNIVNDLSKGGGQYLNSLLDLLKVADAERAAAIKKLRGLTEAYTNISDFADHAIELYLRPGEKSSPAPQASPEEWAAAVSSGNIEAVYAYLAKVDEETAKIRAKELPTARRQELTDYILANDGERSAMGWGFTLRANLPDAEKQFATWYLKEYSDYKPHQ